MNRSIVFWVAVVVLLLGSATAFIWWKISGLKEQLVRGLEKEIGAEVQIASLNFDLWRGELRATGITLKNDRPLAPWEKGEIGQATLHFRLADLFASRLPAKVEVDSWNVVLHSYASNGPETSPSSSESTPSSPSAENYVQVSQLSAHEGSVEIHFADNRDVVLRGVNFEATNTGASAWSTELNASSITAGSLETGPSSVQIQGKEDKITFSNLHVQCGQGFLTGNGEMALAEPHDAHATLKTSDVPVSMLVAVQWQMKATGLVTGDLSYEGTDQTASAHGHFVVAHGKLNVLPWLGKVTALVSLPDISDVELDQATSDFEWKNHALHLSNLDIRKNDVVRIAGIVDVDPLGQVDGKLKLGLPSTITAKWPQLQEKVFSVSFEDYNWTEVHLTGPPDQLKEDLTPRLLAVGLDQGGGLINQATGKAADLFNSLMGK